MVVPLSVAVVARSVHTPWICAALLSMQATLAPLYPAILRKDFIYVIWAAALVCSLCEHWSERPRAIALVAPGLLVGVAGARYFVRGELGVVFLFLGLLAWAGAYFARRYPPPAWCLYTMGLLTLVLSLAIPLKQKPGQRFTSFDHQVSVWLSMHTTPDEPILTPIGPLSEVQPRTGHPVMMELETIFLMAYQPALAPVIGDMARDFYGIDYADSSRLASMTIANHVVVGSKPLRRSWQSKTLTDWEVLASKYNFRLVLSPSRVPLCLTPVLSGPKWTLYTIP